MVLEKILESPVDCKEIQPVHSEGDQPWDFFGRNDAKAETPVLWPIITSPIYIQLKSLQMVTAAMKLKDAYSLEGKL